MAWWNDTDSNWSFDTIMTGGHREGVDFIVHDNQNITAFLVDNSNDIDRVTWDGSSWTNEEELFDAAAPISSPIVPINYHDELQLVCSEYQYEAQVWQNVYAWGSGGTVNGTVPKYAKFYVKIPANLTLERYSFYIYYDKAGETSTSQNMATSETPYVPNLRWGNEEYQPIGNAPTNDQTPSSPNLDDTDNMYSMYKEYIVAANVSDADGFSDLDYIEITLYDDTGGTPYWGIKFNEDTATFSEVLDPDNIIWLNTTGCSNSSSGNTLNITIVFQIHWNHSDVVDSDMRQYVRDANGNSDLDWYEVDWDIESDVTLTMSLDDGIGTVDRGDYNTEEGITASGSVVYQGSALYPPDSAAEIYIACADIAGAPWDIQPVSGSYSTVVDSDDVVGIDTYYVYAVEFSGDVGGSPDGVKINATTVSDTYIADRLVIDIQADDETPYNGVQVNFTLTVTYDYDSTTCTTYTIQIDRNATIWYVFTDSNKTLFNDTNSAVLYLYNASSSGAGVSETTHGLSLFTTNTETVIWSASAAGPVNDTTPDLTNPDDTDNMYAWYREYIITTNHSDDDGFGDIEHVQFSLWDDTRTTEYFRLDFDEDTGTFTKLIEDVSNMIRFNITSSSNASSGIYLNITWHIWIHWNFTPLAGDSDSYLYVNDSIGNTDSDWYETNWDPVTTCSVTDNYLDDGVGTINRGTYGLNNSIWANGTLSYLVGVGGGDNYPPADRVDLWINSSACAYSPWSVTSYDDSTGSFSVLVDSGDSPKISPNYDLYQVTAVEEGGAFSSDNFVIGGTDDYKPDKIWVGASGVGDSRMDVESTDYVYFYMYYYWDNIQVTTGSFTCNDTSMEKVGSAGRWDLWPVKDTVQMVNFSSITGADTVNGVSVIDMSGAWETVIWDRLVIDIQADDESPYNDQQVDFTITVTYEYDNTTCTTYTIQIDRNATIWYVFTDSNKTLFNDTNSAVLYLYNASSSGAGVSETTYGLTVFTTNTEFVLWSATGAPDWHTLPSVRIWFVIALDTWGLYTAIMIMGLIMIPVSGLYLVKGGRKELSSDKLYFTLIIFFVGWALFLGGIMP